MSARMIDGPGKGGLVTGKEAARWLGISVDTLERLAEESDWLAPSRVGASVRWSWEDIVALKRTLEGKKKKNIESAGRGRRAQESAGGGKPENAT